MADFKIDGELVLRSDVSDIVKNIKSQLSAVPLSVDFKIDSATSANISKTSASIKELSGNLKDLAESSLTAQGAFSKLKKDLTSLSIANATTKMASAEKTLAKETARANTELKKQTLLGKFFTKDVSNRILIFSSFTIGSKVVSGFTDIMAAAVDAVVGLDKSMNVLKQITGSTNSELKKVSDTALTLGANLGITTTELLDSTTILAQAGFELRTIQQIMESVAKTELAPTFESLDKTTEGLIAIQNQFSSFERQLSASDLSESLDIINKVSKSFAVESGNIINAVRNAGSVFAAADGVIDNSRRGLESFKDFTAIFSTVRASTRLTDSVISTGLRTIIQRLQRAKSELDLQEVFGGDFTLRDAEGSFLGPLKALQAISKELQGVSRNGAEFAKVIEVIGGIRQAKVAIPLLSQLGETDKILEVTRNALGDVSKDAEIAQERLEVQFAKIRKEFLKLAVDIAGSDSFKTLIGQVLDLAKALVTLAKSLETIAPLLGTLAIARGAFGAAGLGARALGIRGGRGLGFASFNKGGRSKGTAAMVTKGELFIEQPHLKKYGGAQKVNSYNFNSGGIVGAKQIKPGVHMFNTGSNANVDSIPTNLPPGVVIKRDAVGKFIGQNFNQGGIVGFRRGGKVLKRNKGGIVGRFNQGANLVGNPIFQNTSTGDLNAEMRAIQKEIEVGNNKNEGLLRDIHEELSVRQEQFDAATTSPEAFRKEQKETRELNQTLKRIEGNPRTLGADLQPALDEAVRKAARSTEVRPVGALPVSAREVAAAKAQNPSLTTPQARDQIIRQSAEGVGDNRIRTISEQRVARAIASTNKKISRKKIVISNLLDKQVASGIKNTRAADVLSNISNRAINIRQKINNRLEARRRTINNLTPEERQERANINRNRAATAAFGAGALGFQLQNANPQGSAAANTGAGLVGGATGFGAATALGLSGPLSLAIGGVVAAIAVSDELAKTKIRQIQNVVDEANVEIETYFESVRTNVAALDSTFVASQFDRVARLADRQQAANNQIFTKAPVRNALRNTVNFNPILSDFNTLFSDSFKTTVRDLLNNQIDVDFDQFDFNADLSNLGAEGTTDKFINQARQQTGRITELYFQALNQETDEAAKRFANADPAKPISGKIDAFLQNSLGDLNKFSAASIFDNIGSFDTTAEDIRKKFEEDLQFNSGEDALIKLLDKQDDGSLTVDSRKIVTIFRDRITQGFDELEAFDDAVREDFAEFEKKITADFKAGSVNTINRFISEGNTRDEALLKTLELTQRGRDAQAANENKLRDETLQKIEKERDIVERIRQLRPFQNFVGDLERSTDILQVIGVELKRQEARSSRLGSFISGSSQSGARDAFDRQADIINNPNAFSLQDIRDALPQASGPTQSLTDTRFLDIEAFIRDSKEELAKIEGGDFGAQIGSILRNSLPDSLRNTDFASGFAEAADAIKDLGSLDQFIFSGLDKLADTEVKLLRENILARVKLEQQAAESIQKFGNSIQGVFNSIQQNTLAAGSANQNVANRLRDADPRNRRNALDSNDRNRNLNNRLNILGVQNADPAQILRDLQARQAASLASQNEFNNPATTAARRAELAPQIAQTNQEIENFRTALKSISSSTEGLDQLFARISQDRQDLTNRRSNFLDFATADRSQQREQVRQANLVQGFDQNQFNAAQLSTKDLQRLVTGIKQLQGFDATRDAATDLESRLIRQLNPGQDFSIRGNQQSPAILRAADLNRDPRDIDPNVRRAIEEQRKLSQDAFKALETIERSKLDIFRDGIKDIVDGLNLNNNVQQQEDPVIRAQQLEQLNSSIQSFQESIDSLTNSEVKVGGSINANVNVTGLGSLSSDITEVLRPVLDEIVRDRLNDLANANSFAGIV